MSCSDTQVRVYTGKYLTSFVGSLRKIDIDLSHPSRCSYPLVPEVFFDSFEFAQGVKQLCLVFFCVVVLPPVTFGKADGGQGANRECDSLLHLIEAMVSISFHRHKASFSKQMKGYTRMVSEKNR